MKAEAFFGVRRTGARDTWGVSCEGGWDVGEQSLSWHGFYGGRSHMI